MSDIVGMAAALADGDLTAAVPLLDALKEAGDPRVGDLLSAVAYILDGLELGASDLEGAERGATLSRLRRELRQYISRLFWPELPGRDDRLRMATERLKHPPSPLRSAPSGRIVLRGAPLNIHSWEVAGYVDGSGQVFPVESGEGGVGTLLIDDDGRVTLEPPLAGEGGVP